MDAIMENQAVITMRNINKSYEMGGQPLHVLKDVSLTVNQGEYLAILGPSGSGKTTLLSIIAGLDTPESGTFYYEGEDVKKMGLTKYRRNKMAIVFQQYNNDLMHL